MRLLRQGSAPLILIAALLTIAAMEPPSQPVTLSPEQAAREGRALAAEILAETPAEDATNTGVMTIRNARDQRTRIPIRFEVFTTPTNWFSFYQADKTEATVVHDDSHPNEYRLRSPDGKVTTLSASQAMMPFAGSDFSIADLGLEFLHWPEQDLTKKEVKRSLSCDVLESINPHPVPGGYSRVVSWIDIESHGIVMAQAYDSRGKRLKVFIPKKIEKVRGQWQLEEMEIDNDQTGSSTRVDFDLNAAK